MPNTTRHTVLRIVVPLASLLLALSCGHRDESSGIRLPSTPILTSQQQWALVNFDRLRIRDQPSLSARPLLTLFKGNEVEVEERAASASTIDGESGYWYFINYQGLRGWVFGAYLDLYDSKLKADDAAQRTP